MRHFSFYWMGSIPDQTWGLGGQGREGIYSGDMEWRGFGFLVFWWTDIVVSRGVDRQDSGSGNPHAARFYAWQ